MSIQILEPESYSLNAIAQYQSITEVLLGNVSLIEQQNVSVLIVRLSINLNENYLKKFPNLKTIISPTTSLDHIDQTYCQNKKINIISLRDCFDQVTNISSTAEHALGLILALLRKIPHAHNDVVNNKHWNRDAFKSRQMKNLSLGIIGLGRIGKQLVQFSQALGMQCMAYDPFIDNAQFKSSNCKKVSLKQLCKNADIISIHATQNKKTEHLIDQEQISLMKNNALLINTSRSSLLNEAAAVIALKQNSIAGIASDVVMGETKNGNEFLNDSPLFCAAKEGYNIILTPHIGGCTLDAMQQTEEIIAQHFKQSLNNV